PVVPGSMPSTVPRLGVLEDLVRYVEVRVDLLDVVELLELLHETEDPAGLVALDADGRRRTHRDLRRSDRDAGLLQRCLHPLERGTAVGAGGAVDGTLDVRMRHVHGARPIESEPKPEIRLGIAATLTRGEHDLARHLGENDSPLDVRRALLALDLTPL